MSNAQVHFELFVRRNAADGWTLHLASEDRQSCIEAAYELMSSRKVIAVRVTRETLDEETRGFRSNVILSEGMVEIVKPKRQRPEDETPLCVAPADLYTVHARDVINRLLDGWLRRKLVTAFELLHRPDLAEQLEASGVEIQHAIQKIAVPEAQARGISVHQLIRGFQTLVEQTIERIIRDGRRKSFAQITPETFARALADLQDHPDRSYLLGGGVAQYLGVATNWPDKLGRLLDLADAAPAMGKGRAIAFFVLEQVLTEMLGSRPAMSAFLAPAKDLGAQLGAMIRLAADDVVETVARADPQVQALIPRLEGPTARLGAHLAGDAFMSVRMTVMKRVVQELAGPRRLRPDDAQGEINVLRAIAMSLSAASGPLISLEDVEAAVADRSRTLVTADFVNSFLSGSGTAMEEAAAVVRLADNVTGAANKREAARWIASVVGALKFEREMRATADSPVAKLNTLAELQRSLLKAGLADGDAQASISKIGEIGGLIESDTRLVQAIARSPAPVVQKVMILLRMAAGDAAPLGPCADRAKAEVLRQLRTPEVRSALAASPQQFDQVRGLMAGIGLAA
jgi:hypothetical protein